MGLSPDEVCSLMPRFTVRNGERRHQRSTIVETPVALTSLEVADRAIGSPALQ